MRCSFQFCGDATHAKAVESGADHVAAGCGNLKKIKLVGLRANGHGKGAHVALSSAGGWLVTNSLGNGDARKTVHASIICFYRTVGQIGTRWARPLDRRHWRHSWSKVRTVIYTSPRLAPLGKLTQFTYCERGKYVDKLFDVNFLWYRDGRILSECERTKVDM